jgi:predicted nucleotidyltransferase
VNSVVKAVRQYFDSVRQPDVVSAYVFGSHATGRGHRESDVDVALLFDYSRTDRTTRNGGVVKLNSDLIAATHINDVDVIVLNDVSPELAAAVIRTGVRVYCADERADHDFQRTSQILDCDLKPFLSRTRRRKLRALSE